jgi:hypothetical protein
MRPESEYHLAKPCPVKASAIAIISKAKPVQNMQTGRNGARSAQYGSNTTRVHFARAVEPSLEQNHKIGHLGYTEKNIKERNEL